MFYAEVGLSYHNMIIENNLIYDTSKNAFWKIDGVATIRNNTFIGYIGDDRLSKFSYILIRYRGQSFSIAFATRFDGTGVDIYNNIIVSYWSFSGSNMTDPNLKFKEDYNIVWCNVDNAHETKGGHTFLAVNHSWDGYPNYFEDTGYHTSTPSCPYSPPLQPFFVDPNYYTNNFPTEGGSAGKSVGRYQTWDYHLAPGSPGINFGDPNNQPSDSLGTVGPDGFIRDDGPAREATHHSAGCYEYAPVVLSFAPIGNKEVNEGSTLIFHIDINDPNVKTSIEEHNLPSEPNFINNIFSWTPEYNDAGSYEATFVAQTDLFALS
jgi:hypothetical protein